MILQFAHLIAGHTTFLILGSSLMLAPFSFFCIDSLQNPHRYQGHSRA